MKLQNTPTAITSIKVTFQPIVGWVAQVDRVSDVECAGVIFVGGTFKRIFGELDEALAWAEAQTSRFGFIAQVADNDYYMVGPDNTFQMNEEEQNRIRDTKK